VQERYDPPTAYIVLLRANIITVIIIIIVIVVKVDLVILLDVSDSVVLTINISVCH
jgi:hypothetical protein